MKKNIVLFLLLASAFPLIHAQTQQAESKIFWREDFKSGKLPDGWKNVDVYKRGCEWIVTNQPYPGSYEYQQQAPPIASKSRGYHLQYQAGYMVDEDQPSWDKKKQYPDGYVQTAAIDCRDKQSVILRFQQTFRYNNYKEADSAGLYAGISTDGINWHDINVMHNAPAAADKFLPMQEELNITKWAAGQSKVFIRFFWRGYFSWYWMIDDIELAEAYNNDIGIVRLLTHNEESNIFKKDDAFVLRIKNNGAKDIHSDFNVSCKIDNGGQLLKISVPASSNTFIANTERDISFPGVDLTKLPSHDLSFHVDYPGDENTSNNELHLKITAASTILGNITHFEAKENENIITAGVSKLKIIFYRDDIFRIWLAPDGDFTDPAGNDIVMDYPGGKPLIKTTDQGDYYTLQSKQCVVRAYKTPLRFAMYDVTDTKIIWEEIKPIVFGAKTTQAMKRGSDEYFYGCGMQNGYFSHRDKEILIEKGGGWDDGGRANPAPFYMSTAGYGVLRNTYDAGKYAFTDTLLFTHNENRFDAFYFYGPSLKDILGDYTTLTGKPFLMPRWALSLGDANCYNKADRKKQPQITPAVISTVADKYIEHNMPRGWILPNDGYGCGYVKLDSVVKELSKRGFHTGLWTENGIDKIATEVGEYGTRLCKLDVAWVGPGYKYALDACKAAYHGIENNSDARGFIWSVMGWAGTQHYSTVWSGDQSGNWEYIRFHIPTVIGSGLSAQNAATGDVDGIFGGSDSTYTRDLQWKCFTPVFMLMSGWAKKDKQPYISGEPFASINRKYLQLKMRLTPYMYTYCNKAYETGVPTVRAMVLEYPADKITWGKQTQYQFMTGEWLLAAPVYKSEGKRDSIYLPKGKWIDYWNGDIYNGNAWLNNYTTPLDKLPLFVKAGAILPMYPAMNYDGERKADTLTLDIYPSSKSSFDLYEDDGITREHRKGAFAKTLIRVEEEKNIIITIDAVRGDYKGLYKQRVYVVQVHSKQAPKQVLINGKSINQSSSKPAYDLTSLPCYYFDAADHHGMVIIKSAFLKTDAKQDIELVY
jgi:alpha-glucosidase